MARLAEPTLALDRSDLVVLDEIHRRPDLFPVLRDLADNSPLRARYLVLGSASPELLRQSSETLAGRFAFHELGGFSLEEVGAGRLDHLWIRGGLPRALLARTGRASADWRRDFARTFLLVVRGRKRLGSSSSAQLCRPSRPRCGSRWRT